MKVSHFQLLHTLFLAIRLFSLRGNNMRFAFSSIPRSSMCLSIFCSCLLSQQCVLSHYGKVFSTDWKTASQMAGVFLQVCLNISGLVSFAND